MAPSQGVSGGQGQGDGRRGAGWAASGCLTASCRLAVLSLQDSPDASREPMAKLSVSGERTRRCHPDGGSGALPDPRPPLRASSPPSACAGSATAALPATWALTTSTATTLLRALAMKICSAPSQDGTGRALAEECTTCTQVAINVPLTCSSAPSPAPAWTDTSRCPGDTATSRRWLRRGGGSFPGGPRPGPGAAPRGLGQSGPLPRCPRWLGRRSVASARWHRALRGSVMPN